MTPKITFAKRAANEAKELAKWQSKRKSVKNVEIFAVETTDGGFATPH